MEESGLGRVAHYLGLSRPKLALLLPLSFLVGGIILAMLLPKIDGKVPGGALVVQIFLEGAWFYCMYFGFFGRVKEFREKYGEKAYRQLAIKYFLPAGILMVAGILRSLWISGPTLHWFPFSLRILLGVYFVFMGILLEVKGVQSLGFDRAIFLYNVFPEKGKRVESALYQYMRHPLYSAMTHLCVGVTLLTGKLDGFLCALVFFLKLFVWSKIEEKELIERFGEGYLNYRKSVPAFIPKLRSIHLLLQFLLGRR